MLRIQIYSTGETSLAGNGNAHPVRILDRAVGVTSLSSCPTRIEQTRDR
jgi:hypothetical protein